MSEETMPVVEKAWTGTSGLWITNLKEDRHTDQLFWTENGNDGEVYVNLSEAQARDLHRVLSEHIAECDGK